VGRVEHGAGTAVTTGLATKRKKAVNRMVWSEFGWAGS
jgi:hypothetical protein